MKRIVWIISEGSPGHVSQSKGLVAALSHHMHIDYEVFETRPRLNGILRVFVRLWMGRSGRPLPNIFVRYALRCEFPYDGVPPDLIVSSGGKAVFAARTIAARIRVPLVFVGERKPYPSDWFHTVFTPSPLESGRNDVQIEMIPTGITAEQADRAAAEWKERPEGNLWAMIIGGTSASHDFTDKDWQSLGEQMNVLAEENGIRWLVSTSRRTGAPAEAILRKFLDPANVAYSVWWAEKPEKRMAAFLGSAVWVFVTQDSVTMVTEAVASGRPVIVTMPTGTQLKTKGFLLSYFNRLEERRRIFRIPISLLGDFRPAELLLQSCKEPASSGLASTLMARLNWDLLNNSQSINLSKQSPNIC